MNFIKGVDVSMIKDLESHGASYRLNGKEEDLFKLLKQCGINMVRIRIHMTRVAILTEVVETIFKQLLKSQKEP